MMKNRAGLLALAVLAIAILLMVFVFMPRIGGDATKVGDAINQAAIGRWRAPSRRRPWPWRQGSGS
ncbi:hypothetical protein ACC724_38285, partial [Rhizobium ruizarguesonis]